MHRATRTFRTASIRSTLGVAALALLGACGRSSTLDSGLNKDLALADQLQQRNAPALVVTRDSAATAAPAGTVTPARAGAPARTHVAARTVAPTARSARPAPATAAVATVTPAPVHAGSYDPGHANGGEVVGTGSAAPAGGDASVTDAAPSAGAYGTTASTSTPVYQQPRAHTERDAIVGSVAGAIIGVAAGHGVRGALIGAVAGGAVGAVYGHSVGQSYSGYPTYAVTQAYTGTHTARAYRTYPSFRSVPTSRTF